MRSVVISNIPKLPHPSAAARGMHDSNCLKNILCYLSIECSPQAYYRTGRSGAAQPRLMKVVFPCRFYHDLIPRNAPRMRIFPEKGVYIRLSLTKAEHEPRNSRRPGSRQHQNSSLSFPNVVSSNVNSFSSTISLRLLSLGSTNNFVGSYFLRL